MPRITHVCLVQIVKPVTRHLLCYGYKGIAKVSHP